MYFQQLTVDAFWVQHGTGPLDLRDQRGPAVIKEFTQDCVIEHDVVHINRMDPSILDGSPEP